MNPLLPELDGSSLAERLERLTTERPPRVVAVLSALVLLLGVTVLGWSPAAVFGWFWLENVLHGVFFLLRMLGLRGRLVSDDLKRALANDPQFDPSQRQAQLDAAAGCMHHLAPWVFVLHYGLFCGVHLIFVAFFFPGWSAPLSQPGAWLLLVLMLVPMARDSWAFRRRTDLVDLPRMVYMLTCYDRILVLHLSLLFGGMLVLAVGLYGLVYVLIGVKLAFDWSGTGVLSRHFARQLRRAPPATRP